MTEQQRITEQQLQDLEKLSEGAYGGHCLVKLVQCYRTQLAANQILADELVALRLQAAEICTERDKALEDRDAVLRCDAFAARLGAA